ncbi:MAG: hypothetical protein M3290_07590 [Actinomycetota bacterium]|nr:hypothetical protein [Actinomycetota bacterium]
MLMFLGLLFGAFAPASTWWRSNAFAMGLIVAAVFTAIAFISYALAPDWMWMYWIEPSKAAWALPGIALGYLSVFVMSFAAATAFRQLGRAAQMSAIVSALIGEVGIVAITWDRYHRVGTTAQWLEGRAHELFSLHPSGPVRAIGAMGPVFAIAFVVCLVIAWRSVRAPFADR